ncbi:MAG TPA: RNA polymerase sigma factor [Bacteroidales bacterium]|nr:RNA polymerase sigma factor [Bacteroidales bacterium]
MTAIEFNHQLISLEDKLSRFAMTLTANKEDAKDLLQETLYKALSYRDQFVQYTNLKAWTYTIMKNTFINNYRRNMRQNTTFDNTKDSFFLNQNSDTVNISPEGTFAEKEIKKVIESLDDDFKVPFKMHTEGYKYKEIAKELDLKIGTVKSRIFFTRKKLMEILADYQN